MGKRFCGGGTSTARLQEMTAGTAGSQYLWLAFLAERWISAAVGGTQCFWCETWCDVSDAADVLFVYALKGFQL